MYHYVRPESNSKLHHITSKNFEAQLNYLKERYGIVSKDDWNNFRKTGRFPKGALLTFDDGLKDHINYVIPILKRNNFFGIFFVCTDPFHGKAMPVHLTHYLLSISSPDYVMKELIKNDIKLGLNFYLDSKSLKAYKNQNQSEIAKNIKRIINWAHQDLGQREKLSDVFQQISNISLNQFVDSWYLNEIEVAKISDSGFEIGSHTCSHRLLSNLTEKEFTNELRNSKVMLTEIVEKEISSFCFPFGGKNSYNSLIINELFNSGYSESFSVSPSEIDVHLLEQQSIYELPRYDCNVFPYYK